MNDGGRLQALSVAGLDPGGGAGMIADLRVFQALGLYGLGVLTAVTAQNTRGVADVFPAEPAALERQLEILLADFSPAVTKTGMLAGSESVRLLTGYAREGRLGQLVVDPVFSSSSGASLYIGDWRAGMAELLPHCTVITPNVTEAELLTGISIASVEDAQRAAGMLLEMGAAGVCVTGGHLPGEPVDVVAAEGRLSLVEGRRFECEHGYHGTGCLHSAALAGYLALGESVPDSARAARKLVSEAIEGAIAPGGGMKIPWHPLFS